MIIKFPEQLAQIVANELAQTIVADLFSNVNGDVAERLVLELTEQRDGGGWSQSAASSRVAYIIQEWFLSVELRDH